MASTSRSSSKSLEPSSKAGAASIDSGSQSRPDSQRQSSIGKLMDKAKSRMTSGERLPNDENEFEKQKAKEVEKQRKKEEYERLGLGDRTKFGMPGAGSLSG